MRPVTSSDAMALLPGVLPDLDRVPVIGRAEAEWRCSGLGADARRGARPTPKPWLGRRFVSADTVLELIG